MILVTAANANQGSRLVPKLLAAGHSVRACVRSQSSADRLEALGVADVVVGDLADADFVRRAVRGISSVYHVGPTLHPDERSIGHTMIDAARSAGVDHFVFSSVLHAITTDLIQHEIKRDLEEYLLSSGLEFTILQPSNYMLPFRMRSVFEEGVFRLTWSLDRQQSMVAVEDIADVAAMVLGDPAAHGAATYELVGPGRFTAYDIGQVLSAVVGREIKVERIKPADFAQALFGEQDDRAREYKSKAANAIATRYSSHDFVGNSNVLTWLLGRSPTTFASFAREEYARYSSAARDRA